MTTKISDETRVKLESQWKNFEATIGEEAASISGGEGNDTKAMSNFCPEVSYNIFGLFASGLYPHHGSIDREMAHARLAREKTNRDDPGWNWASVTSRHYTECPEYSILHGKGNTISDNENRENASTYTVFNVGTVHGAVGNLNNSPTTVNNAHLSLYEYNSIQQLLIDYKIPKQDRRELEDIMDELKEAQPENKTYLLGRAEKWIVKHKGILGVAAEVVGKAVGVVVPPSPGFGATSQRS